VKEHYLAEYRAFVGNGASRSPTWLKKLRQEGITRFAELGFPSTHQEEWRFTSVQAIAETPFSLAAVAEPFPTLDDIAPLLVGGPSAPRAVFVNGRFAPTLSSSAELPGGVRLGGLAAAIAADAALVEPHLGKHARFDAHPFAALATAFLADGAFVYVPAKVVVEPPLQLLFLSTAHAGHHVSHPRSLIILEREARATLVETYAGLGDAERGGASLTNVVTEIVLGDGARCDHYRVQRESSHAYHVATTHSLQGRDSALETCAIVLGAALSRHDLTAVLGGTGGYLILNGLQVLDGRQHVDHHTCIDHAQPHCESHEVFNGIFDGQARGVFNGRIIVRPGAQRTDSKQTNNNLLLSRDARADSQPQLEIYADDVKCTHGSTVGPLDPTALYYVQSRGLGFEEARALLTYGFSTEILARVGVPEVRSQLDRIVRERLQIERWRQAS
jgi:Fe-S cluster assembly protein SufD